MARCFSVASRWNFMVAVSTSSKEPHLKGRLKPGDLVGDLPPLTAAGPLSWPWTREYFNIIASLLSYEDMRFSEYIADEEALRVSVKGRARFTWKSMGNSWGEVFTYSLESGEQLKVKVYEIWADSGAAYLASKGQPS